MSHEFSFDTMIIPKPDKIANGGEEAFFASKSLLLVKMA